MQNCPIKRIWPARTKLDEVITKVNSPVKPQHFQWNWQIFTRLGGLICIRILGRACAGRLKHLDKKKWKVERGETYGTCRPSGSSPNCSRRRSRASHVPHRAPRSSVRRCNCSAAHDPIAVCRPRHPSPTSTSVTWTSAPSGHRSTPFETVIVQSKVSWIDCM